MFIQFWVKHCYNFDHIRDLEVNLDCAHTFRLHFDVTISKTARQLGFIVKIANEFPHSISSVVGSMLLIFFINNNNE